MRRTKEEAAVTRETLLKAALAVFSAKGYAAATLADVAREAGVTRGAIYWHFGSKADLYTTLVREFAARGSVAAQQAIAEGGPLLEVLRRVFVRQLTLVEEDKDLRALMELALFKTEVTPDLEAGRQRQIKEGKALIASMAEVMRQGIKQGELRSDLNPVEIARAFIAFQNGVIRLWLAAPKSFSLKASAEAFADILIAGIHAQK
ncbi:MAG: TetR family transcriptional regulator [Anaerolineales bacterium]|nr:TetR family transcriptional regulator [Anaerolineales bacterium]